jgi:DNA-binding transcriptional LysR family regulator
MSDIYNDLYILKCVINSGSFMQAGEKLGIAHTTISRQISRLEKHIGKKLLSRTNKGIELTDVGKTLYHETMNHVEGIEQAVNDIMGQGENLHQESKAIKIFLSVGFSNLFVNNIYPVLKEKFPQVKIELSTYTFGMLERDILNMKNFIQHYDICIMEDHYFHAINQDHWNVVARRSDIMKIFASKKYIEKHGEPDTLEALKTHNCLYTNLWSKTRWDLFDENNKHHTVIVRGNFATDLLIQLRDMVRMGYGIALLPGKYFDQPTPENYEIINVLPNYRAKSFDTMVLTNIHATNPQQSQEVAKGISDICKSIFDVW